MIIYFNLFDVIIVNMHCASQTYQTKNKTHNTVVSSETKVYSENDYLN